MIFYNKEMLRNTRTSFKVIQAISLYFESWIQFVIKFNQVSEEEASLIIQGLSSFNSIPDNCNFSEMIHNSSNRVETILEIAGCADFEDTNSYSKAIVVVSQMSKISDSVRQDVYEKLRELNLTLDSDFTKTEQYITDEICEIIKSENCLSYEELCMMTKN